MALRRAKVRLYTSNDYNGHRWMEVDARDGTTEGSGSEVMLIAVLQFLETLEPEDVLSIETNVSTVRVYYFTVSERPLRPS